MIPLHPGPNAFCFELLSVPAFIPLAICTINGFYRALWVLYETGYFFVPWQYSCLKHSCDKYLYSFCNIAYIALNNNDIMPIYSIILQPSAECNLYIELICSYDSFTDQISQADQTIRVGPKYCGSYSFVIVQMQLFNGTVDNTLMAKKCKYAALKCVLLKDS